MTTETKPLPKEDYDRVELCYTEEVDSITLLSDSVEHISDAITTLSKVSVYHSRLIGELQSELRKIKKQLKMEEGISNE